MSANKVYVLTTPYLRRLGRFKIGITKMTDKQLLNTYLRALPDVMLLLFKEHARAPLIELTLKRRLRKFIVVNINGRRSEWVDIDEEALLDEVKKELARHRNGRGKRRIIHRKSST